MTQDKMNNKTLGLFGVGILAVFLMVSLVSALTLTPPETVTLTNSTPTQSVNVSADGSFNLTSQTPQTEKIPDSEGDVAEIKLTSTGTITEVSFIVFEVELLSVDSNFNLGVYTTQFNVEGVNSTNSSDNDTISINVEFEKEFFEGENKANLRISTLQFDTLEGFGDDEDFWYPLDEVEVEFEVENNGNWDVEDIELETCLYDKDSRRCVLDEDDMDFSINDFDLDSGDDQRVRITLLVDPEELRGGHTDYTFYVRAIGEIDDRDANEFDGDRTGVSNSRDIEIITDEKFVVAGDMTLNPETVSCGESVELMLKAWNIDDEDLDDDEVFLRIFNNELGLNEVVEFPSGIDAFDFEEIRFTFEIPSDAVEKSYAVRLVFYEDEDLSDNEVFENSEDDKAEYLGIFEVKGKCGFENTVLVSASLVSGGTAGEELTIRASVTNTGEKVRSLEVSASGYESWANSFDVDTPKMMLAPGEMREATLTLDVMRSVEGTQEFFIELTSDGETMSQPVQVNIQPRGLFGITGAAIGGSGYLWGLGLLNIILVIIIIVVAVKLARK